MMASPGPARIVEVVSMVAEVASRTIVAQVESSADTLVVVAEFPHLTPDELFAYWTEPLLLCRWWPLWAHTEPEEGGAYHLAWPARDWHLRGRYTAFRPGRGLTFTWRWDHEGPGAIERWVQVILRPSAGGTRQTILHGPYGANTAEQDVRRSHFEGWHYFLGRLAALP
jgi:uncharacterized protein YndB with AHSA1/START domain